MILAMLGVFLAHVLLGLPLFLALLTTALVGFLFVDVSMIPRMMPQQFFGGINAFSLMAIPLFILAGNLMNVSSLTDRLMGLARLLVGHLRGGMGHVTWYRACSSPASTARRWRIPPRWGRYWCPRCARKGIPPRLLPA